MRCLLVIAIFAGFASAQCPPMTGSQRAEVETYVRKKFAVQPDTPLQVNEAPAADSGCLRKIEFKSLSPIRKFNLTLYATQDVRFLTTQVFDIKVDPIVEERKRQEAFRGALNPDDSPSTGPASAPVTVTVFSDFQCPFCSGMARTLREDVLPKERGNIRLVFRYFPLQMHPWAQAAAEAEVCVNDQNPDMFWKIHDYIFENQKSMTVETVAEQIAAAASKTKKFDKARFTACVADKSTKAKVARDVAFGNANGVVGTPTIFVNGHRAEVAAEPEQIRSLIREAMSTPSLPFANARASR